VEDKIAGQNSGGLGGHTIKRRNYYQTVIFIAQLDANALESAGEFFFRLLLFFGRQENGVGVAKGRSHSGNCAIHHFFLI